MVFIFNGRFVAYHIIKNRIICILKIAKEMMHNCVNRKGCQIKTEYKNDNWDVRYQWHNSCDKFDYDRASDIWRNNWKSGHIIPVIRETMLTLFLSCLWYLFENFTCKYLSKLIKHISEVFNWLKYMLIDNNESDMLQSWTWQFVKNSINIVWNEVEIMQSNFIETRLRHGCPPVDLLYIFRAHFLKNTSVRLLLDIGLTNATPKNVVPFAKIKGLTASFAQNMKFSIKDFFSNVTKYEGNCGFGHIY